MRLYFIKITTVVIMAVLFTLPSRGDPLKLRITTASYFSAEEKKEAIAVFWKAVHILSEVPSHRLNANPLKDDPTGKELEVYLVNSNDPDLALVNSASYFDSNFTVVLNEILPEYRLYFFIDRLKVRESLSLPKFLISAAYQLLGQTPLRLRPKVPIGDHAAMGASYLASIKFIADFRDTIFYQDLSQIEKKDFVKLWKRTEVRYLDWKGSNFDSGNNCSSKF